MSKLFYISILFFCSCSPFLLNTQGYEYLEMDLETAWRKTASFKYIEDDHGNSYLKSPRQFEKDGGGDCEDFSCYLMYLLGESSSMVIIKDEYLHAIVLYNDMYIEPQKYSIIYCEIDVYKSFTYEAIMSKSTINGTRIIQTSYQSL